MNSDEIKKLKALDKELIWHPFTQMKEYEKEEPLIVERGEGSTLIDIEGKRYLDGVSSLWVTVHGHRKGALDRAVAEQLGKIAHSPLLGLSNLPAVKLAERLLSVAPKNLKKVFYSDAGSTAVEIALKIAFQYFQNKNVGGAPRGPPDDGQPQGVAPTKSKFVTLENAYHGDTIGSVSVGGIDLFH